MKYVINNIRLKELVAVARENKEMYDDFKQFLGDKGYEHIRDFVAEENSQRGYDIIVEYLNRDSGICLYDGILRPYNPSKSRWFFLAWLFRDAPAQRLQPMVTKVPGDHYNERRAYLLNEVREYLQPLYPEEKYWEWPPIAEVMVDRLEGSRRAAKGTLFEEIVRRNLNSVFDANDIDLDISDKEVRLGGETYDLQIQGEDGTVLIPVKTRETMGGGHAALFTRDIHKAISVATDNGFTCLPVVIAESWGGDLDSLSSDNYVYIQANPNQVADVEPLLREELSKVLSVFSGIVGH